MFQDSYDCGNPDVFMEGQVFQMQLHHHAADRLQCLFIHWAVKYQSTSVFNRVLSLLLHANKDGRVTAASDSRSAETRPAFVHATITTAQHSLAFPRQVK